MRRRLGACVHQAGVLPCYLLCASPVRKKFRAAAGSINRSSRTRSNQPWPTCRVVRGAYFGIFPDTFVGMTTDERQLRQMSHCCNWSIHMTWQTAPCLNFRDMALTLEQTICLNTARDLGALTPNLGTLPQINWEYAIARCCVVCAAPSSNVWRTSAQNGLDQSRFCRARISSGFTPTILSTSL